MPSTNPGNKFVVRDEKTRRSPVPGGATGSSLGPLGAMRVEPESPNVTCRAPGFGGGSTANAICALTTNRIANMTFILVLNSLFNRKNVVSSYLFHLLFLSSVYKHF